MPSTEPKRDFGIFDLGSNPLLVKELRGRVRGIRAFIVITGYLMLISCFASLIYFAYTQSLSSSPVDVTDASNAGKVLFASVTLLEILMVTFITPAFSAGAITGERERKTYEMLRATLLPARKVVLGKLTAALAFMFLLVLAAVPLVSLAFLLGGVSLVELILAFVVVVLTALMFTSLGLVFSTLVKTTLVATVLTYASALIVTLGVPLLMLITGVLIDPYLYTPSTGGWIGEAIMTYILYVGAAFSPITTAIFTEMTLLEENTIWAYQAQVGISGTGTLRSIWVPSPWIPFVVLYILFAAIAIWIAILRVRRQERY